jgi:glycerophosphoryl diester phosphodiesterase
MMKTIVTAHSGADGTEENSLAFVRYALASGIPALEVDVRMNDETGELTLGHDAVGTSSALLRDVFKLVSDKPGVLINCDLKETDLELPVFSLATEFEITNRLIFSGSFGIRCLIGHPELLRSARVFLNIEEYIPNLYETLKETPEWILTAADQIISVCKLFRIETVNAYYALCVPAFQKRLAEEGIGLSVWTVNDENAIREFVDRSVTNVTTRNLTGALRILSEGRNR